MTKFICWGLIPFVFLFDRLSKIWVVTYLKEGEGFPIWTGVFDLTRVNNTGAAFGLLKNASTFLMVLTAMSVIFVVVYLQKLFNSSMKNPQSVYGWALITGGALGNLYDRLFFGYVIDFIDWHVWPVFNIADSSICLGVFWVLLQVLR